MLQSDFCILEAHELSHTARSAPWRFNWINVDGCKCRSRSVEAKYGDTKDRKLGDEVSMFGRTRGARHGTQNRHQRRREPFVLVMLLHEIWRVVEPLPIKPIVTVGLIGLQILIHFFDDVMRELTGINFNNIHRYCLHPQKGWQAAYKALFGGRGRLFNIMPKETFWPRVFLSALIHADDTHLYYNMTSFCVKGVQLEGAMGPERFAFLIIYAMAATALIMILLSRALVECAPYVLSTMDVFLPTGYETCTVGFSGVIFCLKYVLNHGSHSTTRVHIPIPIFGNMFMAGLAGQSSGLDVPTKWVAWVELIVISLVTPNASFLGHFSGIAAGVIWVHCGDINDWLVRKVRGRQRWDRRAQYAR